MKAKFLGKSCNNDENIIQLFDVKSEMPYLSNYAEMY